MNKVWARLYERPRVAHAAGFPSSWNRFWPRGYTRLVRLRLLPKVELNIVLYRDHVSTVQLEWNCNTAKRFDFIVFPSRRLVTRIKQEGTLSASPSEPNAQLLFTSPSYLPPTHTQQQSASPSQKRSADFLFLSIISFLCPVGWGCGIHRLLLCRGVRLTTTNECPDMTLNNLMGRFQQCWSFGECGVSLYRHRSPVHSGPEW